MPENDEIVDPEDASGLRARLEEANRRAAVAEAEAAGLKQRDLFRDAGLDPASKQHNAFMRAYDGELTPDAVKSYVQDLGVNQAPPPPPAPSREEEAQERIAAASTGGGAPAAQPDRREQLRQELDAAARRGATSAELDTIAREFSQAGGFPVRTQ